MFYKLIEIIKYYLLCLKTKLILHFMLIADAEFWLTNVILGKKIRTTISFIIFWDFSMFYQTFLSPQVKRWAINTYKHGINELPHELPNDWTPRHFRRWGGLCAHTRKKLRKLGNIRTMSKPHRMVAHRPAQSPLPKWKLC